MQFVRALSFVLGAGTFVAVNFVLFLLAYPTLPNPGPQSDIRLPVAGAIAVVLAITLLLGRAGRAFGLGFGTGLLAEALFMSGCTTQWAHPGGTALADAAAERRRPVEQAIAVQRDRAKWISEMRHHGVDLAEGVSHLRLATGCVLEHRRKQDEYPPAKDSLPDAGDDCYEVHRVKDDPSGWRILYSLIPGKAGDPAAEFRVRAGPDAALGLPGPLLETDYRGLILRRDSADAPAFSVGSPLQPITAVLLDCIRKGSDAKPESRTGVLTLHDLVFTGERGCFRIQLEQVKNDNGAVSPDPNVARLYLPTTGPYVGIPLKDISTSWDLSYVPQGKTPADGYDLHVRPMMYGYTGIRSYLLTAGTVHVTWQDRRATPSDPLAEACEIDINKPCGS